MLYRYINEKWLILNYLVLEVRVDNKINFIDWSICVFVWINY